MFLLSCLVSVCLSRGGNKTDTTKTKNHKEYEMNTKLLSKEVIRGLLKHEYNNDPRITDKVLFDGKQLTLQGYILLKSILPTADYRSCCLDGVAHHCYVSFEFDSDNNNWNYDDSRERAIVREKMKPIINRLETIVGDDECYFVSDVITGELEESFNRYNGKRHYIVHIWVFGHSGDVMEFAGDNNEKRKLLLETV